MLTVKTLCIDNNLWSICGMNKSPVASPKDFFGKVYMLLYK